jgi:hypothetical protein
LQAKKTPYFFHGQPELTKNVRSSHW